MDGFEYNLRMMNGPEDGWEDWMGGLDRRIGWEDWIGGLDGRIGWKDRWEDGWI